MKSFFALITGTVAGFAMTITMLWPWIGILAGIYMGVQAALEGAGVLVFLFHTLGYGLLFGIGTLVFGVFLSAILAFTSYKLWR